MEPNRMEFQKQCAFQSFCKRVCITKPATPAKSGGTELRRSLFPTLPCMRNGSFIPCQYFESEEQAEPGFNIAGKRITAKLIAEALRTLPEEKRKAVLLYYFAGMTDVEIGKIFDTSRSTIKYRRTSSFELLKRYLEEHADEWDEW